MRRDCRLFDADGHEVFVTMTCLACGRTRPFRDFGIRRMGDGTQRSIPWCRACRGGAVESKQPRRVASAETIAVARQRLAARGIQT